MSSNARVDSQRRLSIIIAVRVAACSEHQVGYNFAVRNLITFGDDVPIVTTTGNSADTVTLAVKTP